MVNRRSLLLLPLLGACYHLTAPRVPLDLIAVAKSVDGKPLPVFVQDRAVGSYVTRYVLYLTPDGLWHATGRWYSQGATPADSTEFSDNGYYRYDGSTLELHSNFLHASYPATIQGDTIRTTVEMPIAADPHALVLSPGG